MKTTDRSRRKFIATGALALTGLTALGYEGISLGDLGQTGPVRIGLIGTGSRGQGLATLLGKIQSFELVACCDIIPENLQGGMKLAAKGARSYTDYKKLLQDKDVQAVIIATPLYLHHPMAVDAIAAGSIFTWRRPWLIPFLKRWIWLKKLSGRILFFRLAISTAIIPCI